MLLWSGGAVGAAGTPAVSARLDFVSRGGCGTAEDLVRRLAVRSPRIHFAQAGSGAPTVRVEIERAADGFLGATLTFVQAAGRRSSRHVRTGNCDEALNAIALILAVTLDPSIAPAASPTASGPPGAPPAPRKPTSIGLSPARANGPNPAPPDPVVPVADSTRRRPVVPVADSTRRRPVAPVVDSTRRRPETPVAETPVAEIPVAELPSPPDSTVARPDPAAVPVASPPPPAPSAPPTAAESAKSAVEPAPPAIPPRFVGSIGLHGQALSAPAPRVMPGVGAYAILAWDRPSLWSPTVRIAATHFWTSSTVGTAGVAGFQLDLVALDLCPVWLRHPAFGVGACVEISGGRLEARGSHTFAPETHARPFGTGGASVIVTFEPGLGIEITASIAGAATLVRDRFQFSPDVFHEAPAFALTTVVGVGLRFW